MSSPRVIVLGAGIGGLTTAAALRAIGIEARLFEAAPALRAGGTGLGLASNAAATLRALGIDPVALGRPARTFELCTPAGRVFREIPIAAIGEELGAPTVSVDRGALTRALRAAAPEVPITFGARALGYELPETGGVVVRFADGRSERGDVLIGADGIGSVVRDRIQGPGEVNEYGYVCWLAVTEFRHPRVTPGWIGHYWGSGKRFGLIELGDGQVYWWGTANMPAAQARSWSGTREEIAATYAGWAPEIGAAIAATPRTAILSVPARDRDFDPRWGDGPVTLLGDAAHPMLTSLSQGAGSAIEDGYVLARSLAGATDPVAALRDYERARIPRTRMLVEESRKLSRTEQWDNPLLRRGRDLVLEYAPAGLIKRINMAPMRFPVEPLTAGAIG
ncbi:FAD-dependent monooxygenase [Nocardia thailandica]